MSHLVDSVGIFVFLGDVVESHVDEKLVHWVVVDVELVSVVDDAWKSVASTVRGSQNKPTVDD